MIDEVEHVLLTHLTFSENLWHRYISIGIDKKRKQNFSSRDMFRWSTPLKALRRFT